MKYNLSQIKGIPPGRIIDFELKKRGISQRGFAKDIQEHNQTLNAVIKGRRNLTVEMALKIEKALGFEEGFLLILQDYYLIDNFKRKKIKSNKTAVPKIRKVVFWDTDFDKLDWVFYKKSIIKRVFERGNEFEKKEILNFYNVEPDDIQKYL